MRDAAPLSLRPAHAGEARVLAEMSRELVEAGLGWRYTPSRMAALMRDPDIVVLVACDAAQVAGFAAMQFGDEHAHLVLLCVAPAQQRCGIGRRLTEWLVGSARVAGIASIRLELRADNAAALAFYRHLGFTETQHLPGYYGGRIAARRMERTLRPQAATPLSSPTQGPPGV
jgi:[ribosomal protein S18]-alanine N-acetyltransferase